MPHICYRCAPFRTKLSMPLKILKYVANKTKDCNLIYISVKQDKKFQRQNLKFKFLPIMLKAYIAPYVVHYNIYIAHVHFVHFHKHHK